MMPFQSTRASSGTEAVDRPSCVAWFCLRTQPKREQIAASQLRRFEDVEVFNPRIRFDRTTRNGRNTVTESLFPNYLFAKFNWLASLTKVHYSPGVSGIVHFGTRWPTIPNGVIEELRLLMGKDELKEITGELSPGDVVEVAGGAFHGLAAVITQVMPGRQRVMVLMDFLGRQTAVEMEAAAVIRHRDL